MDKQKEKKTMNIVIVGAGRGEKTSVIGGAQLIELLKDEPYIHILGVADLDENAPGIELARRLNIPTSTDFYDFLNLPNLNVVFNATGLFEVEQNLFKAKPAGIEIMGGWSTKLMEDLLKEREDKLSLVPRQFLGDILRDFASEVNLSEIAMVKAGERFAERVDGDLKDYLTIFKSQGLGELNLLKVDRKNFELIFTGSGLIESYNESKYPQDNFTRGYLARAVSRVSRAPMGCEEMECQARGDELCRFVVYPTQPIDSLNLTRGTGEKKVSVETILDCIPDGIFTTNKWMIITSFNKAAERITGIPAEEAIGMPCRKIFKSELCGTLQCELKRAIENQEDVIDESTTMEVKGIRVPITSSTSLLRDETGKVVGGVKTFRKR
ncbi:MAG: PAS domain-containing protein [bacterium]